MKSSLTSIAAPIDIQYVNLRYEATNRVYRDNRAQSASQSVLVEASSTRQVPPPLMLTTTGMTEAEGLTNMMDADGSATVGPKLGVGTRRLCDFCYQYQDLMGTLHISWEERRRLRCAAFAVSTQSVTFIAFSQP